MDGEQVLNHLGSIHIQYNEYGAHHSFGGFNLKKQSTNIIRVRVLKTIAIVHQHPFASPYPPLRTDRWSKGGGAGQIVDVADHVDALGVHLGLEVEGPDPRVGAGCSTGRTH